MTSEMKQTVTRSIHAPAGEIFDLLTNPDRHAEIDGSDMVRSADHPQRITGNGQTFRMNQHWDAMGGDYQTDNYVSGYQHNTLLAWKTAPAGEQPPGWEWLWELKSSGADSTDVSLTYDWSSVTDKATLKKVHFPAISDEQMEGSLASLAAAVESTG